MSAVVWKAEVKSTAQDNPFQMPYTKSSSDPPLNPPNRVEFDPTVLTDQMVKQQQCGQSDRSQISANC